MTFKLRPVVTVALLLICLAGAFASGLEESAFLENRSTDPIKTSVVFYFAIIVAFGAMFVSGASGKFVVAVAAGSVLIAVVVSIFALGSTLPWSRCCDGEAHPMVIVVWFGIMGVLAGVVFGLGSWLIQKAFVVLKGLISNFRSADK